MSPDSSMNSLSSIENDMVTRRSQAAKPTNAIGDPATAQHEKLIDAIERGKIDLVRDLLERHASILHSEPGEPALHCAAKLGQVRLVELLLQHQANIESEDEIGLTAMTKAVMAENALEVIDVLLDNGAPAVSNPPRNRYRDWKTPMWLAAVLGKLDVVKRLLQVDKKTLRWIVRDCVRADGVNAKDIIAAKTIVECGADSNCVSKVLHIAAVSGCLAIFCIFKDQKPELATQQNSRGWTAMHLAAYNGWTDIVEYLLDHYPVNIEAVTDHKWTALHCAADRGHHDIVAALLARRADATAQTESGYAPVFLSCFKRHDQTAMILLKAMNQAQLSLSDKSNNHEDTLLRVAALGNCPRVVERLIQYAKDNGNTHRGLFDKKNGRTIFYDAISTGQIDVVRLLLEHGASTEGSDEHGNTSLHWAANLGMRDVALYLLKDRETSAKDLATFNEQGETPVVRAAESNNSDLVPLLLEQQDPKPVSQFNTTGWQPLHWAARYNRLDIVSLLVMQGADVSAKDSEGRDPASIARQSKPMSIEILEWLNPPKVDIFEDEHLPPRLTRPRADIAPKSMCKTALVHVVGLYPTCAIQKSDFSVYNFLYEYGPQRTMAAVTAARQVKEPLDFRWIHLPANNKLWIQDLLQSVYFDSLETAKAKPPSSNSDYPERSTKYYSDTDSSHSGGSESKEHRTDQGSADETPFARRNTGRITLAPETLEKVTLVEMGLRMAMERAVNATSPVKGTIGTNVALNGSQKAFETESDEPKGEQPVPNDAESETGSRGGSRPHVEISTKKRRTLHEDEELHWRVRAFIDNYFSQEAGPLHARYIQPAFKWKGIRRRMPRSALYEQKRRIGISSLDDVRVAVCIPYFIFTRMKDLGDLKSSDGTSYLPLTLDQYHYHSIPGTEHRTNDQVLFRYQEGVPESDRFVCMVNHLWIHVLDDKTIATSCWQHDSADVMDSGENPRDLRKAINDNLVQDKDRLPRSLGVYAGILAILGVCVRKTFEWEFGPNQDRLLSAFSKTIARAEVEEVRLFDEFETGLKSHNDRVPKDKRQFNGSILREIKLLKEIKDVLDELGIIERVFRSQRLIIHDALDFFHRRIQARHSDFSEFIDHYEAFSKLDVTITELDNLRDSAKQTQANIHHILDLKQKDANLSEAIWARKASENTEKQGRTVLVFTVVTIIFLPSTFLTSLFALDITTFPHNSDGNLTYSPGWAFPMIFGITIAVSVPLIIIAFFVNEVSDFFSDIFDRKAIEHRDADNDEDSVAADAMKHVPREGMSLRGGMRRRPICRDSGADV